MVGGGLLTCGDMYLIQLGDWSKGKIKGTDGSRGVKFAGVMG